VTLKTDYADALLVAEAHVFQARHLLLWRTAQLN